MSDVILKPAETCLRLGEEYVLVIILQLLYNQIVSCLIAKWAFSRRKIGTFENQNVTNCTSTTYNRRQESVRSAMKMGENSMAEGKKKKKGKDAETFQQPCL